MSIDTEQYIKEQNINYYEYSEFDNIVEIGSGKVFSASWDQNKKSVTLKSFSLDNTTIREIICEIKLHQQVDFNDNIVKFYGITKADSEYLLVMDYTEGDTLRDYLEENFSSLNWQDTYGLAFQLSSAIQYLHEKGIVHKDLHSNNIYIQQNSIKLADSGLSKRIKNVNQIDTIPYIDPRVVNSSEREKYKLDEKSDVYSVGMLFWELSSGRKPFADKEYGSPLAMEIAQGSRESIIESTPKGYSDLYTKCWDADPGKRPTIQEVVISIMLQQFKLNHGLLLDGYKMEPSKQAVFGEDGEFNMSTFIHVDSSNEFYLETLNPKTNLEEDLIENNISAKDAKNVSSFPFIKKAVESNDSSREDNTHFLVKCERYKISLNKNYIKPSKEFKRAIEEALESMEPLMHLQNVFDEYGHFYPLSIVFGKSLKNILPHSSFSITPEKIDLTLESLKLRLNRLDIRLLTQRGNFVEEDGLSDWLQNTNNDLEIIEYNNIIPLYDILEVEQRRKINIVLNRFKIIMIGSADLKGLDNNIEHYKRINVEPSLESENYEVFGSIISKDNLKLEDIYVTFGSYDVNGFSATIRTLKDTNINITDCHILWMIIGNPVFSSKDREIQVDLVKESIALQPNDSYYYIKTSRQLSQGHVISVNTHCSEHVNLKFVGWSKNYIHFEPIYNFNSDHNTQLSTTIEITVCNLTSDYEDLKIDNRKEVEYSLDSIGYALTENNFLEGPMAKKDEPIVVKIGNSINGMMQHENSNAQKYINRKYPTKKEREKETELTISKQDLGSHLDLSDFINLEKLDCSDNQLTSLDISKNMQLVELDCSHNQLINIKFPVLNNEKLEDLNLLNNKISSNLSYFSRFINIKKLFIGNTDEDRIKQGIYNQFHGSLEPLKNLLQLKSLNINNTDIDSGLEYLPDGIKNFQCLANKRPEAKVRKIYDQLETFATDTIDSLQGRYNLKAWKENWELVKEKEALQKQLVVQQSQMEEQTKELVPNEKLRELKKEENNLLARQKELMEKNTQLEQDIKNLEKNKDNLRAKQKELVAKKNQLEEDIDSGLEYLPDSIKIFQCLADKSPEAEVRKIYDQLESFASRYNLKAWKENLELVKDREALQKQLNAQTSQMEEQTKELTLNEKLTKLKEKENNLLARQKELKEKTIQLEQDIKNLDARLTKIEEDKDNLLTEQKDLVAKKIQLEEDIKTLQRQHDNLKDKLEQIIVIHKQTRQKLDEKEKLLKSFTADQLKLIENEGLKKEANDFREELLNIKSNKKKLEENLEKINMELKTKEEESSYLHNQLIEIETNEEKLNLLKEELDKQKFETKKSTTSLRKQMENLKILKKELKIKRKSLEEIKRNDEILQKDKNHLQNLLKKCQKDEQDAQEKLVTLEKQLKDNENFINVLQQKSEQQIDKLKGQLKEANTLLEETRRNEEDLKKEKNRLQNLLERLQIQTKEAELKGLTSIIGNTCDLGKPGKRLLKELLDIQKNFVLTNGSSTPQKLEKIKQELHEDYDLTKEQIDNLLNLQTEITRLSNKPRF